MVRAYYRGAIVIVNVTDIVSIVLVMYQVQDCKMVCVR